MCRLAAIAAPSRKRVLVFLFGSLSLVPSFCFAQEERANPAAMLPIRQPGANLVRFEGIVFADRYTSIQAAINDTPIGGEVFVPAGTFPQGANAITLTGKQLVCAPGAMITFAALGQETDAVTLGWADSNFRTGIEGCVFDAAASGRDGIQVGGGNHWFLRNITVLNFARDCLHVEPNADYHWSENSTVSNFHCLLTMEPASTLRDGIRVAVGDKFSASLTGVYVTEAVWQSINIRAYGGNGIHYYLNDATRTARFTTHNFIDVHTDGGGHESSTSNPAIFFELISGPNNPMNSFTFIGGGSEDTVRKPSGAVFQATNQSLGVGVTTAGFVDGNFPKLYDKDFFTAFNGAVVLIGPNTSVSGMPTEYWKDSHPSHGAAIGMQVPGNAPGDDLTLSMWNAGAWTPRIVALANGGISFRNSSGTEVAFIDNGGNLRIVGSVIASTTTGLYGMERPATSARTYYWPAGFDSVDPPSVASGRVVLDAKGESWVSLPEEFNTIGRSFHYELTPIGSAAPKLHVASTVEGNRFKIAGGKPHAEVSWQVTAARQAPLTQARRSTVGEDTTHGEPEQQHDAGLN